MTTIQYDLPKDCHVRLEVFGILSRIDIVINEKQTEGRKAIAWDSRKCGVISGIYLYGLTAGEFEETKRMLLVK